MEFESAECLPVSRRTESGSLFAKWCWASEECSVGAGTHPEGVPGWKWVAETVLGSADTADRTPPAHHSDGLATQRLL